MTEISKKRTAIVFGYGYLGTRVAKRLLRDGWDVVAVTRCSRKAGQMREVTPFVADWTDSRSLRQLPAADRVLVAVGWDRNVRQSQYEVYVGGLRNVLQQTHPGAHLVYVSSTGVYHQCDGSWVDETSPCRPKPGSGGWAHLKGEELLRKTRPQATWTILRMAGLYGPQRVPRARDISSGKSLSIPTEGFLNLIHIDDAADCVMAAWDSPASHRVYAISDGHPVNRKTYYEEIARILRVPMPLVKPLAAEAPVMRRSTTNKRIWNARMRQGLCPKPTYPSYKQGLRAILSTSR